MRLTKTNVNQIEVPPGRSELIIFDEGLPGFGLRVRAGGKRTWVAQFRIGTKQRRISLGSLAQVDPDEARRRAKEALAHVSLGRDPQAEKAKAKAQVSRTLGSTVPQYLAYAQRRQKPNYHADAKRYLERHWAPLASFGLHDIDRVAVSSRLGEIASESGPFAANRARAALSAFFSWAMGEGAAQVNPVLGTHLAAEKVNRDRVLSDEELALVWQLPGPGDFGTIARLLILTACRREEVAGLRWSELQGSTWTVPGSRTKNHLDHVLPLPAKAMDLVAAVPRRDDRELVFGSGAGPFSGWSRAKAALDARMLAVLKERHGARAKLAPWRLHDLRRTAATRMADLGVLPHVVEAVLNHMSGARAGVAGIYNRASYLPEKKAALETWAARVETIVGGTT